MSQEQIYLVSLGCAKNRVDSEIMLGVGLQGGYRITDKPEEAQVIVVNTCGFIDAAKEESVDTILELGRYKSEGACKKLIVAGCLSQRYSAELAENMPEVDHFLGSSDMLKLKEILQPAERAQRMQVGHPANYLYQASDPRVLTQNPYSAYIKIAEGCSRACSFCAIPSFRGKQRSRQIEDIYEEALRLTESGVLELNLISQDTLSYGRDLGERGYLLKLLERLGEVPKLHWLRVFYLYPEKLSDELIALFAEHPKVVPYVDMPLQHASDNILRRMHRGHGGARLYALVERLRKSIPDLTFRSGFIVGHPGESEADFKELCEFVRWAEFDRVGVFSYSQEEGTPSGAMSDQVAAEVIAERYEQLTSIQQGIAAKKQRSLVGQQLEVLIEGVSEESEFLLQGRHAGQAPEIDGVVILSHAGQTQGGDLACVRITHAADADLVGRIIAPEKRSLKHLPLASPTAL